MSDTKRELPRVHDASLDAQALIASAIEHGASVETMERLVALAKDVRAAEARRQWYEAMSEFHRRCPPVLKTATAKIMTKSGGSYEYRYAPLDKMLATITPLLSELGLSVRYVTTKTSTSTSEADRASVTSEALVSHIAGHVESSGPVTVPILPDTGRGANAIQLVGIAVQYSRRYATMLALGISPEDDADAAVLPTRAASEPRRKSAPPPVADPQADAEPGVWTGKIVEIAEKTGTKKDGTSWTLYTIKGEDGMTFGTFSARAASEIEVMDGPVTLTYSTTARGGRNIESWGEAGHD